MDVLLASLRINEQTNLSSSNNEYTQIKKNIHNFDPRGVTKFRTLHQQFTWSTRKIKRHISCGSQIFQNNEGVLVRSIKPEDFIETSGKINTKLVLCCILQHERDVLILRSLILKSINEQLCVEQNNIKIKTKWKGNKCDTK